MISYKDTESGKKAITELKSKIINKASGVKKEVCCTKCNGSGNISGFAHVMNGVCFDCGGSGKIFSYRTNEQKNINNQLKNTIQRLEEMKVLEENEFTKWLSFDFNPYSKDSEEVAKKYFAKLNIWDSIQIGNYVNAWISNSITQIK